VYRAGAAPSQESYESESAVHEVFTSLDEVEGIITGKDYFVGGQLTEADDRLYVTVVRNFRLSCGFEYNGINLQVRFDPVYV
jgi:putative glutathione S-transferase